MKVHLSVLPDPECKSPICLLDFRRLTVCGKLSAGTLPFEELQTVIDTFRGTVYRPNPTCSMGRPRALKNRSQLEAHRQ
jgi:hypothetical protein